MCTTTREAFQSAIDNAPDDDAPKLVYADYLDEIGESEQASTIRSEVKTRVRAGRMNKRKRDMAIRVWEWAKAKAEREKLPCRDALEFVTWTNGYAETGYSDPEVGLIAFANWNDVGTEVEGPPQQYRWRAEKQDMSMGRFSELLERLGVEIEWSDEWMGCGDCGKAVRCQSDSYGWKPSYNEKLYQAGECVCLECEPDDKTCPECSEELDTDCNGNDRCPECDGPCPCCSDQPSEDDESEDDTDDE